jgi:hypothetical protein
VKAVKPGAVIADVAIDQGGCAETSRPTTHSYPTYLVDISTIGMIMEVMTDDETVHPETSTSSVVALERRYSEKEEAFWRKRILPVEEKEVITGRGYRWFRSSNITCIEQTCRHYRRPKWSPPSPQEKVK